MPNGARVTIERLSVEDTAPSRVGEVTAHKPTLKLLGGFDLVCTGRSVGLPLSAQRLLAFVALHGRALLRSYVAGSLWLDSSEERAQANLRSALWRLNRGGQQFVRCLGPSLALDPDLVVDLRRSESVAHILIGASRDPVDVDVSALTSDLLPDWYDDWLELERERFRQLRLRALESLCERLTAAGRLDAALDVALAAVVGEPLRESGHRAVVRVHLAQGNVAEAVRQYRLCRRLLYDHLGLEPSAQMAELLHHVDLTLPAAVQAGRSPGHARIATSITPSSSPRVAPEAAFTVMP